VCYRNEPIGIINSSISITQLSMRREISLTYNETMQYFACIPGVTPPERQTFGASDLAQAWILVATRLWLGKWRVLCPLQHNCWHTGTSVKALASLRNLIILTSLFCSNELSLCYMVLKFMPILTHSSYLEKLMVLNKKILRIVQFIPLKTHVLNLYKTIILCVVVRSHRWGELVFCH